jgi:hypothetical protein
VIADDLDERRCVFLAGLYRAEREIAEKLKALAEGKPAWPLIDADKAIPWVEKRTKLALAQSQIKAVRARLESVGDHRRPGCRQDDAGQLDPQNPPREERRYRAMCAYRSRRQIAWSAFTSDTCQFGDMFGSRKNRSLASFVQKQRTGEHLRV